MPDLINGKKPAEKEVPFPDYDLDKIIELLDEAVSYLDKVREKMEKREVKDLENK